MEELTVNLNNLCFESENPYDNDDDIKEIFRNGITPENILNASRAIRVKEKSRFLKFPVAIASQINVQQAASIKDLQVAAETIYSSEIIRATLESIELVDNDEIILRVLGPFSTLLESIGPDTLFKWLYKYKNEIHSALSEITEILAGYINSALSKGVTIISLAEPSAIVGIIGERRYREFVLNYNIILLRRIESYLDKSILHICPKTSYLLERYNLMVREVLNYHSSSYAQALIDLKSDNNIKFIGHRCINNENAEVDKIYVLRLL